MNFNDYQKEAMKTAIYPSEQGIIYTTLGLASEAGEVAGVAKKRIRGDYETTSEFLEKMIAELGDTLWYLAMVAEELGITLDAIAGYNLTKLKLRAEADTIKGEGDYR